MKGLQEPTANTSCGFPNNSRSCTFAKILRPLTQHSNWNYMRLRSMTKITAMKMWSTGRWLWLGMHRNMLFYQLLQMKHCFCNPLASYQEPSESESLQTYGIICSLVAQSFVSTFTAASRVRHALVRLLLALIQVFLAFKLRVLPT
jgi:uncharacterized membrane protein YccC